MLGALVYRDYQPGDEPKILDLFKRVFGREMSYAFWRWRFEDNPSGHGIIKLALDGEKLVGHASVLPMTVQFHNELYRAIFPMTAMTHPDHSGRGIHSRLLKECYDFSRHSGFTFAYGFFNQNVLSICINRMGYHDVIKMSPLEKRLEVSDGEKLLPKDITPIASFDERFDRLWATVKPDYPIIVPRSREFLNWRFTQYPEVDYAKFAHFSHRGDILGYIVLKVYITGDTNRGHIIDLLSVPDTTVVDSLIQAACHYFWRRGIVDISGWVPAGSFYNSCLVREGFTRGEGATYFGAKLLDPEDRQHLGIEKSADWHLTMGDSDVF